MRANKQLAKKLNRRFAEKQDELDRRPAVMGDGAGNLHVTGFDNFVYVTMGDKAVPVFNNRVPPQTGLQVWVGYAAEEPTLFQVLSTRSETPAGVQTGFVGYAPARRYEWMARNGGQDPLSVHLRAFTPLKLSVSPEGWMFVDLYRGFVYAGGSYIAVPRQNVDLYAQIPTTAGKAAFVLITIDTTGAVVQTKGSEVNIEDLVITDIPAVPASTAFVCGAVRVYYGQLEIQEGRTNTDFVDLRFPGYAGGGLWQPLDADLTSIAGLSPANDDVIQRKAGAWVNRTISQLVTDIRAIIDSVYVALTGNQTIAGVKTFSSDLIIPDEAYDATAWNGSLEPPTKNAVRDKIESMGSGGISDAPNDGVYYGRRNLGWTNLKTYFDTLYALLLASTASNDFQVGDGSGGWIKKTLAETITILRTSLDSIFAPIAKGVTNGDSHDHNGGDGAQIAHGNLSSIGTNTHAQIDTHIAAANPHSGSQPLDGDLTAIAALAPANDDVIQRKAGAWVNRTIAQLVTDVRIVIDSLYVGLTSGNAEIASGKTYNVDGSPHTHTGLNLKNHLINGGFNFWQRITPTTATAMTDDIYNAPDRWYSLVQGAGATINRNAGIGTSQYSAKLIAGGTTNRYGIAQIIEAENSIPLRGQTVIAQCRIKPVNNAGSGTRDYRIAILEWTGTADTVTSELVADWTSGTFTTAGFFASTTKTLVGTAVVTATHNTETVLSVSGAVSTSCNNLIVFIWTEDVPTHASDYVLIGESGLYSASELQIWNAERVSDEQARCLRYYEVVPKEDAGIIGFGQCYATTNAYVHLIYSEKRIVATPTIVNSTTDFYLANAGGGNVAVTSFGTTTRKTRNSSLVFPATASGLVAGNATMLFAQVTTAKITIDAEL